jgi:tRNA(fMet)-specific endonuclease VapC
MAICVVDTNVWSYVYKGRDEGKLYEPHLIGNILVISFQRQAELVRWAVSADWGPRGANSLNRTYKNMSLNIRTP